MYVIWLVALTVKTHPSSPALTTSAASSSAKSSSADVRYAAVGSTHVENESSSCTSLVVGFMEITLKASPVGVPTTMVELRSGEEVLVMVWREAPAAEGLANCQM